MVVFQKNFTDIISQLMRDDGITHLKGPREKHSLFSKYLLMLWQNPKALLQTSLLSMYKLNCFGYRICFVYKFYAN